MFRPLEGVRVLDLSRVLAGPYAAKLLQDLGADVLRVEAPWGTTRGAGARPSPKWTATKSRRTGPR